MAYSYYGAGLYSDSLYSQNPILDSNSDTYGVGGYGIGLFSAPEVGASITAAASSTASGTVVRVHQATASATPSASITASARRVPEGSALVYGTSSTASSSISNGARVRTGDANPAGDASSSTSSATRVREDNATALPSASVVGSGVFLISASGSTSVSASLAANGRATFASSGSLDAASDATSSGDRILDIGGTNGSLTFSAVNAVSAVNYVGSSGVSSATIIIAAGGYVQRSSAAISSTSTIAALGREKWEPIPVNSIDWNNVAA